MLERRGCSIPSPTLGYDKVRADASVARQTLRNHGSLYHESCQSREEAKKSCEPKQLPPIVDPAARAKKPRAAENMGIEQMLIIPHRMERAAVSTAVRPCVRKKRAA